MSNLILYRLGDNFTVDEIDSTSSLSLFKGISYSDILKIQDESGYSNLERIFYGLTNKLQEEFRDRFTQDLQKVGTDVVITTSYDYTVGTLILIPVDKLNRAVIARSGGSRQIVTDRGGVSVNDSDLFIGEEIERIQSSPGYRQLTLGESGVEGFVKKISPTVQVWLWCRTLSRGKVKSQTLQGSKLKGRWVDISKYVLSVETSTDSNGGNFQIQLPPITGIYSEVTDSWEVDSELTWSNTGEIFSKSSLYSRDSSGRLSRNRLFFTNAISENDIILVSFEPLWDDKSRVESSISGDGMLSDFSTLSGSWNYDMIGLVDTVSETADFDSGSLSVSVSGRDLSKLIIEDGSYIFPLLFQQHNWIYTESDIVKRNLYQNSYDFYASSQYRTVQEAVQWVINTVSTIKIVPDEVVSQTTYSSLGQKKILTNNKSQKIEESLRSTLWGARDRVDNAFGPGPTVSSTTELENIISQAVESRLITFSSYSHVFASNGVPQSPQNIMLGNYKGVQIEYIEDPGSVTSSLLECVKLCIDLHIVKNQTSSLDTVESVGGGIWSYVKLLFDKSIENRRLADASLGKPDGSLINLIRNYVQEPWVEMVLDTWGSNYYYVFRTPPTNGKRILELYRKGLIDNVVIEDVDVRTESLQFDTEVYSLFQLDYKGGAWGDQEMLITVMPTVILPDYAEIWGNRKLSLTTNMIPFQNSEDVSSASNVRYVREKGIEDLMFVVNSHFYKPFTRKGTIVVNGDRRLKKGTWFYYKPTNEIFYITGVSQSYTAESIDRVTTLTVERGMVLDYVLGKTVDGVEYSYFNIVKSEYMEKSLKSMFEKKGPSLDSDVTVYTQGEPIFETNREVFEFFLKKKQLK